MDIKRDIKRSIKRGIRVLSTAAILAGSIVLSPKIQGPGSSGYTGNTIYIAAVPPIESNLKSENATIVIDPGHDDKYIGYHTKGIREEVLNLTLSKRLEGLLEDDGCNVMMTRNSGTRLNTKNLDINKDKKVDVKDELYARSNYIRNISSDCDILIHYNANPFTKYVKGMEIYFYGVRSLKQIEDNELNYTRPPRCKIYSEPSMLLAEKLGQYIREQGIDASAIGSDMRILRENPDRMMILIEVGYLTTPSDVRDWTTPEGQKKIASLLHGFFEENIGYIKKVNHDYSSEKDNSYVLAPEGPQRDSLYKNPVSPLLQNIVDNVHRHL